MSGRTSSGVDWKLEVEADKILHADRMDARRTDNSHGVTFGILSPDQLALRHEREILTPNLGKMINTGVYHRAYNPEFGKRPHHKTDPYGDVEFDSRVPLGQTTSTAYPTISPRDPAGVILPRDGRYWHLTRYQRSRIRRLMRAIGSDPLSRHVVRQYLADQYGVPVWVISRCLHKGR